MPNRFSSVRLKIFSPPTFKTNLQITFPRLHDCLLFSDWMTNDFTYMHWKDQNLIYFKFKDSTQCYTKSHAQNTVTLNDLIYTVYIHYTCCIIKMKLSKSTTLLFRGCSEQKITNSVIYHFRFKFILDVSLKISQETTVNI